MWQETGSAKIGLSLSEKFEIWLFGALHPWCFFWRQLFWIRFLEQLIVQRESGLKPSRFWTHKPSHFQSCQGWTTCYFSFHSNFKLPLWRPQCYILNLSWCISKSRLEMTYATLMYLTGGVDPGSLENPTSSNAAAGGPWINSMNSINSLQFFLWRIESFHFKLLCKDRASIFPKA